MPWSNWSDVSSSLKGIKPQLTLAQANSIARQADAIGGSTGWAVAISNFKKTHKVSGDRWVKKSSEVDVVPEAVRKNASRGLAYAAVFKDREVDPQNIDIARDLTEGRVNPELLRELATADVNDGDRRFVAQEDDGPTVGHLSLLLRGGLAGRAWAKKQVKELPVKEAYVDYGASMVLPLSVFTFADLEAQQKMDEAVLRVEMAISQFQSLANNILWSTEIDRRSALQALIGELQTKINECLEEVQTAESQHGGPNSDLAIQESSEGLVLEFGEADETSKDKGSVYVDIEIIRPGWGNSRDNNFYPREVLERDAKVFEGCKMYETDHNQGQKSTRTWVSTITEIVGFTEQGGPIGRAFVHDPNFAERLTNLNEAGLLNKMECSIVAYGTYNEGTVDGKKGNIIESFTRAKDVDWVTAAGAGGRALRLVGESEEGLDMTDEPKVEETQVEEQEIEIHESEAEDASDEPKVEEAVVEPIRLEESFIEGYLSKTKLPKIAVTRLSERQYETEADLKAAVEAERNYITQLTGAGEVFGNTREVTETSPENAFKESEAQKDEIVKKFLGR